MSAEQLTSGQQHENAEGVCILRSRGSGYDAFFVPPLSDVVAYQLAAHLAPDDSGSQSEDQLAPVTQFERATTIRVERTGLRLLKLDEYTSPELPDMAAKRIVAKVLPQGYALQTYFREEDSGGF